MPGLTGPYLKVSRAKQHLDALDAAIEDFRASEPYVCSSYEDLDSAQYVVTVKLEEPPLSLALMAGDFICCLRASLDYLAWQLALRTMLPKFPSRRVGFPIFGEFGASTEREIAAHTKGIPKEAVMEIKSLQPYNHGPAYKSSHLWRLHTLWNIEKHRHLTIHSCALDVKFPGVKPPEQLQMVPLDDGCIMRLPISSKPDVNFKPRATMSVAFGDVEEGIELQPADLRDMYDYVGEKVIPRFATFFSHP